MTLEPTPTAAALRIAFDAPEPLTLGLEEELMLLDAETLDLLPRATDVVEACGDERFKLEMPAAQLELALPPVPSVPAAIAALAAAAGTSPRRPRPSAGWARPASTRSPTRSASSTRVSATRGPPPSTARSPGASSSARCRCTSRSVAPTARSPSTTGCDRGCR